MCTDWQKESKSIIFASASIWFLWLYLSLSPLRQRGNEICIRIHQYLFDFVLSNGESLTKNTSCPPGINWSPKLSLWFFHHNPYYNPNFIKKNENPVHSLSKHVTKHLPTFMTMLVPPFTIHFNYFNSFKIQKVQQKQNRQRLRNPCKHVIKLMVNLLLITRQE